MSENLFNLFKSCSSENKANMSKFLNELYEKQNIQETIDNKLLSVFTRITQGFSLTKIRQISKSQRNQKDLTNFQYNYGQITFETVFKIFQKIKKYKQLTEKEVFYDLGSGSGKVLLAAGICHQFAKCKGIQYLQSLFKTSLELKRKVQKQSVKIQEEINQIIKSVYQLPIFEIYNENFETKDWSDGTVIFVSSTCYSREVMYKITNLCQKLQKGTILITLTRSLQGNFNQWRLLQKFEGDTSWGPCTVFIHIHDN